tara:strand:- start:715 stop:927 length:213 start_codon:yes stop_codon:yes gene_type:complete
MKDKRLKNSKILDKNKSLLFKTAKKYNLSLQQTFNLVKFVPNKTTKILSQDDANKLALEECLYGEGLKGR